MRILVTGGYGFIGSNFIQKALLHDEVEQVVNVDVATYAANRDNVSPNSRLINIEKDINDQHTMEVLMNTLKLTHVVHFAAESHVDNSIASPDAFIRTNINGTFSLLEAARKCDSLVRFHHVSTDEVYGSLSDHGHFHEHTAYDPRSPYSASKASSDHLVRAYHHTYNLPTTISNCSNNYGPHQHVEKLIPKAITNIAAGKKVPIYGAGINIRDWLYVDDHCDAIWKILTASDVQGDTFNIGGDCELKNIDIISMICKLMNVSPDEVMEFVDDRQGHDYRYAIDHSKITNKLNWAPAYTLDVGLKQTINYYTRSRI